jgi:hypothetical protein
MRGRIEILNVPIYINYFFSNQFSQIGWELAGSILTQFNSLAGHSQYQSIRRAHSLQNFHTYISGAGIPGRIHHIQSDHSVQPLYSNIFQSVIVYKIINYIILD